jgi:NADH-quinone oxidoreductase subunit C
MTKTEGQKSKQFSDKQVIEHLKKRFPKVFSKLEVHKPGIIIGVLESHESIMDVSKFIKNSLNFKYPLSVSALDWPEHYEVIYHIVSYENNNLLELHLTVTKDDPEVMSVTRVWKGADPHEREAYDMFGIRFKTHPDLRRILLPEDVDYYPLRKDFPLGGDKDKSG